MSNPPRHRKKSKTTRNALDNSGPSHQFRNSGYSGHSIDSSSGASTSKMNIGYIIDQDSGLRSESIPSLQRSNSFTVKERANSSRPGPVGERRMSISSILNSPGQSRSTLRPGSNGAARPGNRETDPQNYLCSFPQCGARFSTYSAIKSHRANAHGLESYQCIYCKTVLAREANLMYHVNSKHRKPGQNWCYKCTFKSFDFHAFKNHMETVHASRKCSKCGQQIPRNRQVQHSAQCNGSRALGDSGKRGRR